MTAGPLIFQITALADTFSGVLGVAAKNLTTGEELDFQSTMKFHPASTIKLPVLCAVYQEIDNRHLSLDESLPLDISLSMRDGGVMDGFTPNHPYPVRDLCHLMITISDNTATNMLIRRIGFDAVDQFCAEAGMADTKLNRYIGIDNQHLPPNQSTPADMIRLLELLATEKILTPPSCKAILNTMLQQKHHSLTTRYIDDWDEELAEDQVKVRIASKSGWFRTVRHDVAVIWTPRATYVLAMYSKDCADPSYKMDNEAAILLPKLSRAVYDAWGRA